MGQNFKRLGPTWPDGAGSCQTEARHRAADWGRIAPLGLIWPQFPGGGFPRGFPSARKRESKPGLDPLGGNGPGGVIFWMCLTEFHVECSPDGAASFAVVLLRGGAPRDYRALSG